MSGTKGSREFSHLCLPLSLQERWDYSSGFYMASGESNSISHCWMASVLPAKPSPQPQHYFSVTNAWLKSQITLLKLYIYLYILYWLLFYILLSFRFCAKIKSDLWYLDVAQWSNASVLTWVLGSVLSPGKWGGVVTALKYLITVCTVTFIGQLPFMYYCVPFSSGHELPRSLSIWESLSRLHFLVDSFTSYSVPS